MNIEEIKRDGARKEVASQIENRIHSLTNHLFEGYRNGDAFNGLGAKINEAFAMLDDIRELLHEAHRGDGVSN